VHSDRQIRVGHFKNVIVFDPLLAGHVIRRMRSSRVRIFNGNQRETLCHNSRTDRRRVFKLGSKVGHVTRHAQQLFKVKRSKIKVTKSRDVSADKNAITRQCMDGHINFKLGGNYRRGGLRVWYTF